MEVAGKGDIVEAILKQERTLSTDSTTDMLDPIREVPRAADEEIPAEEWSALADEVACIIERHTIPSLVAIDERVDVRRVQETVRAEVGEGRASTALLRSCRFHCLSEVNGRAVHASPFRMPGDQWPTHLPAEVQQLFERLDLEVVDSLGPDVAVAVFVGPTRSRLVVSRDADIVDADEFVFVVFRAVLLAFKLVEPQSFGVVVDYKKDSEAPILRERKYREALALAGAGAAAIMDEEYADPSYADHLADLVWVRTMKSFPTVLRPHVLGLAKLMRKRFMVLLGYDIMSSWLARSTHGPIAVGNQVQIARTAWWARSYLIWRDPDGNKMRTWIPTRGILNKLPIDTTEMTLEDLRSYEYFGMFFRPGTVKALIEDMKRSRRTRSAADSATDASAGAASAQEFALEEFALALGFSVPRKGGGSTCSPDEDVDEGRGSDETEAPM